MRFLITATPDPSKPAMPAPTPDTPFDEKVFSAYMKFNEDMHKAGVLVASEGLNPQKKGARVGVVGGRRTVLDGPFVESKELVGGFYLVDVKSLDEAIAWALKAPTGFGFADLLTIHPMTEEEDIPPELVALIKKAAPTWSLTFKNRG